MKLGSNKNVSFHHIGEGQCRAPRSKMFNFSEIHIISGRKLVHFCMGRLRVLTILVLCTFFQCREWVDATIINGVKENASKNTKLNWAIVQNEMQVILLNLLLIHELCCISWKISMHSLVALEPIMGMSKKFVTHPFPFLMSSKKNGIV